MLKILRASKPICAKKALTFNAFSQNLPILSSIISQKQNRSFAGIPGPIKTLNKKTLRNLKENDNLADYKSDDEEDEIRAIEEVKKHRRDEIFLKKKVNFKHHLKVAINLMKKGCKDIYTDSKYLRKVVT